MFATLTTIAFALSLVVGTSGHGYVHNLEIQGKSYSGYLPFTDPYTSPVPERIVRAIPGDGPILDIQDPNLACNVGGQKAAKLTANVAAGSAVTFQWQSWPSDHLGPVSSYMASCSGDCSSFDPSSAKWFKVDAAGYDAQSKQWASAKLIADNASWTSTIPSSLAPGQYLIRHEIIALHDASAPQFYPMCAQVEVTGNGNRTPSPEALVSIPGLYDNVKFPDIWSNFGTFTTPGPAVAFGGSDSDSTSPSSSQNPSIRSQAGTPTSTPSQTPASSKAFSSVVTSPSATPASVKGSSSVAVSPSTTGRCRRGLRSRRLTTLKRHASFPKRYH